MFSDDQHGTVNLREKYSISETSLSLMMEAEMIFETLGPCFGLTPLIARKGYAVNVQGFLIFCYTVPHNLLQSHVLVFFQAHVQKYCALRD
jgi:hypothetical protein